MPSLSAHLFAKYGMLQLLDVYNALEVEGLSELPPVGFQSWVDKLERNSGF